MTESPLMSRMAVREYLGINEAMLKGLISKGELRPHGATGSFNRSQVESFAQKCAEEIIDGNLERSEEEVAGKPRYTTKPHLVLQQNTGPSRTA